MAHDRAVPRSQIPVLPVALVPFLVIRPILLSNRCSPIASARLPDNAGPPGVPTESHLVFANEPVAKLGPPGVRDAAGEPWEVTGGDVG